jgi:hypothetical protein
MFFVHNGWHCVDTIISQKHSRHIVKRVFNSQVHQHMHVLVFLHFWALRADTIYDILIIYRIWVNLYV